MIVDLALWNALISTVTLIVVAAAAIAAIRQIRHLREQNTLAGLLKVLEDWRDPEFQKWLYFIRVELVKKIEDPSFMDDLDGTVDRSQHPELHICDWYEQMGSFMKHGLLSELIMMDVSSSSCNAAWAAVEPVVMRMRRTRGDALYENFEYMAVRGLLFQQGYPNGCYPKNTPRMAVLRRAVAETRPDGPAEVLSAPVRR